MLPFLSRSRLKLTVLRYNPILDQLDRLQETSIIFENRDT